MKVPLRAVGVLLIVLVLNAHAIDAERTVAGGDAQRAADMAGAARALDVTLQNERFAARVGAVAGAAAAAGSALVADATGGGGGGVVVVVPPPVPAHHAANATHMRMMGGDADAYALVHDLMALEHPAFAHDVWHERLRLHMGEAMRRGAVFEISGRRVEKRQMDMVLDAIGTLDSQFEDAEREAEKLSGVPDVKNVTYSVQPVNAREIFEGTLTGLGAIFVPGLRDVENGTAALALLQSCVDWRKWREPFMIKDLWKSQGEAAQITQAEVDEFADAAASMYGRDKSVLEVLADKLVKVPQNVWKVMKWLGAMMKKLQPYVLQLLRHATQCGLTDIVLGLVVSFIIGLFPPLLVLLIPLAAVLLAVEVFQQIRAMIEHWRKNWFLFGKATGMVIAYITTIIIAYKNIKGAQKQPSCPGRGKRCTYELPGDENKRWSNVGKHCPPGNTCNKVYQRDDLIDPFLIDNKGRSNVARMKSGLAPIGPDGRSVNLHHVSQTQGGSISELSATYHKTNHKALHTFLKPGEPSRINRELFDAWRSSYWRSRGAGMEQLISSGQLTAAAKGGFGAARLLPAGFAAVKGISEHAGETPAFIESVVDAFVGGADKVRETGLPVSTVVFGPALGTLDFYRWVWKAFAGKVSSKATALEDDFAASARGEASDDAPRRLVACSWAANCTRTMHASGERFDQVDGQVTDKLTKPYRFHFAPDAGWALSVAVFANEGAVNARVVKGGMPAGGNGGGGGGGAERTKRDALADAPLLPAPAVAASPARAAAARAEADEALGGGAGVSATAKARASYVFAVQHCDGYGPYELRLEGSRNAPAVESEDPEWAEFWAANGRPADATAAAYELRLQYAPYPTVSHGSVRVADASMTSVTLEFAPMLANIADEGRGQRYHVFYTADAAADIRTVCDVQRAATYGGTRVMPPTSGVSDDAVEADEAAATGDGVNDSNRGWWNVVASYATRLAAAAVDASAAARVSHTVDDLAPGVRYRFFVIAENAAGAMTLYRDAPLPAASAGADATMAERATPPPLGQSVVASTTPLWWLGVIGGTLLLCYCAIFLLYVLRKRRIYKGRLPMWDKHLKRIRLK